MSMYLLKFVPRIATTYILLAQYTKCNSKMLNAWNNRCRDCVVDNPVCGASKHICWEMWPRQCPYLGIGSSNSRINHRAPLCGDSTPPLEAAGAKSDRRLDTREDFRTFLVKRAFHFISPRNITREAKQTERPRLRIAKGLWKCAMFDSNLCE